MRDQRRGLDLRIAGLPAENRATLRTRLRLWRGRRYRAGRPLRTGRFNCHGITPRFRRSGRKYGAQFGGDLLSTERLADEMNSLLKTAILRHSVLGVSGHIKHR